MKKLDAVILMHLANESLTVQQICEELELSPSQVHRKVKSLTGLTPFQYLRSLRLDHAQSLIKTTAMNVSEIALIVGFKELSSFSDVFKKEYGMTPVLMRKVA